MCATRACTRMCCAVLIAAVGACKKGPSSSERVSLQPEPSSSVAKDRGDVSPIKVGIPQSVEKISEVVNPLNEAPYSGPVATLRGRVRIEGDAPEDMALSFPEGCGEAAATYGKLFRVGQDGAVADALVAVTGYKGFVPARDEAKSTTIHGCAFSKRTIALTFGQRIEVSNLDGSTSYMPYLDGAAMIAIMVAVPKGAPVKLYPQEPGHYLVRDQLPKPFLTADVFALKYATHDVTGLDGAYEITGIPVGKVNINAYLHAINKSVEKEIELHAGDNALDLMLEYRRAGR